MTRRTWGIGAVVVAIAGLVACATQKAAAPAPAEAPKAEASEKVVGPPEVAWKDMTKEQRGHFMKAVVVPDMQPLFAKYDAKRYEKVTCKTCHGSGVADHSFKMPSPDLPKLPHDMAGFAKLQAEKPAAVKFMAQEVEPEMAKLLGLPKFDPQHPQPGAVSCTTCHTNGT